MSQTTPISTSSQSQLPLSCSSNPYSIAEMSERPIGPIVTVPEATPPSRVTLTGRTVKLEPLTARHAEQLFPLLNNDHPNQTALWDYIPDGPFDTLSDLEDDFTKRESSNDPLFFAIIDNRPPAGDSKTSTAGKPLGYLAYMNISPEHRRLEIGHVMFSLPLQRTVLATETVYLLLKHALEDLGYRRVEWKCNALNAGSKRAAARLGFQYEGTFRQHLVVKGRNRDTAWFSILRDEWEGVKGGFEGWFDEGNFDERGEQRRKLEDFRKVGSA
ncbi:acyl-CoA N-acyltransferase [Aspergillus karnatakaensis]|uniref:GNAT family N-acetyltransferase n=1 Tax=Aspergillus karnatakaensis TaxID=1810916 RepID=UPI003CCE2F66